MVGGSIVNGIKAINKQDKEEAEEDIILDSPPNSKFYDLSGNEITAIQQFKPQRPK